MRTGALAALLALLLAAAGYPFPAAARASSGLLSEGGAGGLLGLLGLVEGRRQDHAREHGAHAAGDTQQRQQQQRQQQATSQETLPESEPSSSTQIEADQELKPRLIVVQVGVLHCTEP